MQPTDKQRSLVLITGASSGIGADFARVFAREGHDLVLVARSTDRLEAVAAETRNAYGTRAHIITADLSVPGAALEVHRRLAEAGLAVDVLVNNAGFGLRGAFVELDAAKQLEMVQLNVVALTELTRLIAPQMVARGAGRILNVASTAAFQPGPSMAVYFATKAFVMSLSQALAAELSGTGVTVTCLSPGATDTAFATQAGVGSSAMFRTTMSSQAVAEAGYRAQKKGKALVVPGLRNRLLATSVRLIPMMTAARISRSLLQVH